MWSVVGLLVFFVLWGLIRFIETRPVKTRTKGTHAGPMPAATAEESRKERSTTG
jgi:hypothetical protein